VVSGSGSAAARHHKPLSSYVDEHFARFCGMYPISGVRSISGSNIVIRRPRRKIYLSDEKTLRPGVHTNSFYTAFTTKG
jgi:hypothetical protein